VEVENLRVGNNEADLVGKFEQTYFPAVVELGWLIQSTNKSPFSEM
jgi:hypothetical protein